MQPYSAYIVVYTTVRLSNGCMCAQVLVQCHMAGAVVTLQLVYGHLYPLGVCADIVTLTISQPWYNRQYKLNSSLLFRDILVLVLIPNS